MHKIAAFCLALSLLAACSSKAPIDAEPKALADSSCSGMPDRKIVFANAAAGNEEAMGWADLYYSDPSCGAPALDHQKSLYWAKRRADIDSGTPDDEAHIRYVVSSVSNEVSRSKMLGLHEPVKLDPLLLWAWLDRYCKHPHADRKCTADDPPYWATRAEWQKMIKSSPRSSDTSWYQYLPKGCEKGECLPQRAKRINEQR